MKFILYLNIKQSYASPKQVLWFYLMDIFSFVTYCVSLLVSNDREPRIVFRRFLPATLQEHMACISPCLLTLVFSVFLP